MGKKRADGRKPSSGKKSEHLLIRLSPDEKRAFSDSADLAGLPLSGWVRERLRWAATKELQGANRQVSFLHPMVFGGEGTADASDR